MSILIGTTYYKMIYLNKRRLQNILSYCTRTPIFIALLAIASCSDDDAPTGFIETVITPPQQQPKSAANRLTYFAFLAKENPRYLSNDVIFDLSDSTNQHLTAHITQYVAVDSLIASFKTTGMAVHVNNTRQQSDTTANDYREAVTYTVMAENGQARKYTITVQVFTGLPVLTIETKNHAPIISKDNYVKGTYVLDGFDILPDLSGELEIQGRGNSTFILPKKPYQIKFPKKEALLGPEFGKDKKWILLANYTDKTMLRTETAFAMSRLSNLDFTPGSQFVEVFLNGSYEGTYQLTQKVEISENRVNVTDNGFLLEVDQLSRLDADDVYFRTSRHLFNVKEPDVDANGAAYNQIKNFVTAAEDALYSANFKDTETGYAKYLDTESFIDWYLINEISRNNDAVFYSSCYMNIAPGGKLKMGPVWDFDISFGNINYNGNDSPTGFYIKIEENTWYSRLFQDPKFADQVKKRFKFFMAHKDAIIAQMNINAKVLNQSQRENDNRWHTIGAYIPPNAVVFNTYDEEVQYLQQWINIRMNWLSRAFDTIDP